MGPTGRGWLGEGPPDRAASRIRIKGNGPGLNTLARREPRWDGEGRQGRRDRLVEGSDESNDPKEDEGAEALRAALRLATRSIE